MRERESERERLRRDWAEEARMSDDFVIDAKSIDIFNWMNEIILFLFSSQWSLLLIIYSKTHRGQKEKNDSDRRNFIFMFYLMF